MSTKKNEESTVKIRNINSIFEEVFEANENTPIYKKYKSLIKMCEKLTVNFKTFTLKDSDIHNIFDVGEHEVNYCKVSDRILYYEFDLNYDYQGFVFDKILELRKKEYKFTYDKKEYYCFNITSMKDYLEKLLKLHEYYIEIQEIPPPYNKVKDIEQFLMLNYPNFKIVISYQYKDINYTEFNYNSLFNPSNNLTGQELNLKLGHYVSLSEEDFNSFQYYNTKERENFAKNLFSVLAIKNVIGLCGPYGTGKTISLLRICISQKQKMFFYINMKTIIKLHIIELRKLLRYEVLKLFPKDNFYQNDSCSIINEIYNKIIDLIEKYKGDDIFQLIIEIISNIKNIDNSYYFIIDQFNSNYDTKNLSIQKLIKHIDRKNIHLIICTSINNENILQELCNCLNQKVLIPFVNIEFIYYFYVGSLIRLNNLENYDEIIKKESQDFFKYLNYFGNMPEYYYSLKRAQIEGKEFEYFVEKEKDEITEEIKLFYKNNTFNQMIEDIIKIMSMINQREIFFFDELKTELLKLPLNFFEIKKEIIDINDLKLFGLISNNIKIQNFIQNYEKNPIYNDDITTNHTKFINKVEYLSNYISQITKKEKKEINFIETNFNKKITIYYFDYLFPLMEEFFSSIIYETLSIPKQKIYDLLSTKTKEGLLEYIINEKVKNSKQFSFYLIKHFETIENFVPNEFFIQNYTSRKISNMRNFIENKKIILLKKKLPKENIFFTQYQFTGKYYDCGILMPTKDLSEFNLLLFQISKSKLKLQKYFREEHMIIMNRVKSKLEREFDIKIKEGHFSYILAYEEKDDEVIEFCEKNNLNYMLFSMKELCFKKIDFPIMNEKTFITKIFPIHSSFSILPKENFLGNFDYDGVKKFQNKLNYYALEENLSNKLKIYFKPVEKIEENDTNEFIIFGHFNNLFKVNNLFCLWFNNDDLFFYYYDNNCNIIKSNLEYTRKLSSGEKFSLICSKYKIMK